MFAKGVVDYPVQENQSIDFSAHELVSRNDEEEAIVLLKNTKKLLPLKSTLKKILVIGAHADVGVLSGGGSSQVYPIGGMAVPDLVPQNWPGPVVYFPSSPLEEIKLQAPQAAVIYYDGKDPKIAAQLATEADVAIVFAQQWVGEANDAKSLTLPDQQNLLISTVSHANRHTIVVLETGGPVTMPWIKWPAAVLEAWYPGTRGGQAIARILFGKANPSGHLPVSFLQTEAQLVRRVLDGDRAHEDIPFEVNYREGAAVGYKWLDVNHEHPLFAFGYGLSYTQFTYSNLAVVCQRVQCRASFMVTNTGTLAGKAVPQIYVAAEKIKWEAPKRLAGWEKIELDAGQSKTLTVAIEPRLLALYEPQDKLWHVHAVRYTVILAQHADDRKTDNVQVNLPESTFLYGKNLAR